MSQNLAIQTLILLGQLGGVIAGIRMVAQPVKFVGTGIPRATNSQTVRYFGIAAVALFGIPLTFTLIQLFS